MEQGKRHSGTSEHNSWTGRYLWTTEYGLNESRQCIYIQGLSYNDFPIWTALLVNIRAARLMGTLLSRFIHSWCDEWPSDLFLMMATQVPL
jgi:hypothetical protein